MMTIEFDPAEHAYKVGGVRLPSVSQILGDAFGDPTAGRGEQWHMDRGSAAHALYALLARGEDLSAYVYDERLQGHVEAWRAWYAAERPEWLAIETPIEWRGVYAGTPDAIVRMRDKVWVIDYKQTATLRDRLQMAAYAMACGLKIDGLVSIQIDGERWKYGETCRAMDLARAVADWRAVLRTWQLKQEIK
jgi:hypothetical protein